MAARVPAVEAFGIDIGGTGVKGAPVDLARGRLLEERFRVLTPHPATPKAVAGAVTEVVEHFGWKGPVGCTFPAIVREGITLSAAHVDRRWIGADAAGIFSKAIGARVGVINDADAAGLAEVHFGAGRRRRGTVLLLTFGTGIGSALFRDSVLIPNMQLGHLDVHGQEGEARASLIVRETEGLSWKRWARRVNRYLAAVETISVPDLIIIGGGASNSADKFMHLLEARADLAVAGLRNEAGIVGAALHAQAGRARAVRPAAAGTTRRPAARR